MPHIVESAPPLAHPYAFADLWARAGWSPIPSPVPTPQDKRKKPAIAGVSGWGGIEVDADLAWMLGGQERLAHCNVGLRMRRGWLGIDIDAYHGGLATVTGRQVEWGELPPSIYSTNRDDGSEIRYYRCPPELVTVGNLDHWGTGVDLVQRHHRFAVVSGRHWSGRSYRIGWHDGAPFPAEPGQVIWRPEQAADLPESWVQGLRKTARRVFTTSRPRWDPATEEVVWEPVSYPRRTNVLGVLRFLERARVGERNSVLFWAGCRVFEGTRDPEVSDHLAGMLLERARRIGLPDSESLPTLASARWTAGGR